MNFKTIGIGLLIAFVLVIIYTSTIRDSFVKVSDNDRSVVFSDSSFLELISFDNGSVNKQNLQLHWDSLQRLNGASFSDSTLLSYYRGYLHFSLWQLYQSVEKLTHSLHHDLYVGPENGVRNPNLPLTPRIRPDQSALKLFSLEKQYNQIMQRDSIYHPHNRINLLGSGNGITDEEKLQELVSNALDDQASNITNFGVLDKSDDVFMINPYLFSALSYYHADKSIDYLGNFVSLTTKSPTRLLKARLKLVLVYGAIKDNESIKSVIANWDDWLSTLTDSVSQYQYEADILEVLPFLLSCGVLRSEDVEKIFSNSSFPHIRLLFELISDSWGFAANSLSVDNMKDYTTIDYTSYDDPILTPLFVLYLAEYLYEKKEYQLASDLIGGFWYEDNSAHPPELWWFDNYPDFLVRSYLVGRRDGSKLPFWVDDFHRIVGNDPTLLLEQELAKFYNNVAFYGLVNPVSKENEE